MGVGEADVARWPRTPAAATLRGWRSTTEFRARREHAAREGVMAAARDDEPRPDRSSTSSGCVRECGWRCSVEFPNDFLTLLRGRAAEVVDGPAGCDIVLLAAEDRAGLAEVESLAADLRHDAVLWIVRTAWQLRHHRAGDPRRPAWTPAW